MNLNSKYLFYLIVILSIFLRIYTLDKYDTWNDEKLAIREANGLTVFPFKNNVEFNFKQIKEFNTLKNVCASTVKEDGGNGIFYITCLHFWSTTVGNSDFSIRLLSALFGILLVILMYYLCLEVFHSKQIAMIAMIITAIHPQLITYSQEARTYSLALFIVTLSSLLLFKIINNLKNISNPKNKNNLFLGCYALLMTAGILSHYSTVYIFLGHLIILLININLKNSFWIKALAYLSIVILLLLVWYYIGGKDGLAGITIRNQHYIKLSKLDPSNPFYMATNTYSFIAGWAQNLLTFTGNTLTTFGYHMKGLVWMLIIPILLIFYGLPKNIVTLKNKITPLIILTFISVIYASILSLQTGHIIAFQQLYSIFSIPYFILILSYCIRNFRDFKYVRIKFLFYSLVLTQFIIMAFSVIAIYTGYDSVTKNKNPIEVAADKILKLNQQSSNFTIVYNNEYVAIEMNTRFSNSIEQVKQKIVKDNSQPEVYLLIKSNSKVYKQEIMPRIVD